MITEALLSILFGAADLFLGFLPEIEWTANTGVWEYLRSSLSMIAYLVTWQHVSAIGATIISITMFRICIAIIRTVKGLIPFAG